MYLPACWSWLPNTEVKLLSVTKLLIAGGAAVKPTKSKIEKVLDKTENMRNLKIKEFQQYQLILFICTKTKFSNWYHLQFINDGWKK